MSLLSYASSYSESNGKRQPRMKSTYEIIQNEGKGDNQYKEPQDVVKVNENKMDGINSLINKMGLEHLKNENDGSNLENYNCQNENENSPFPLYQIPKNTNENIPIKREGFMGTIEKESGSSYSTSYLPTPYYNSLDKKEVSPSIGNNKQLVEKLNYMIQLLEEQQKEPTQNILEEFVLYGLLGVFIIYVLDSFTKVGKYTR